VCNDLSEDQLSGCLLVSSLSRNIQSGKVSYNVSLMKGVLSRVDYFLVLMPKKRNKAHRVYQFLTMQHGRGLMKFVTTTIAFLLYFLTWAAHCNGFVDIAVPFLLPSSSPKTKSLLVCYDSKRKASRAKGFGRSDVSRPTPQLSPRNDDMNLKTNQSSVSSEIEHIIESSTESSTTPEDRAKKLLREKYGMRTIEEQQQDATQLARRKEEQEKWGDIKKRANSGDDFDLFAVLPGPVLIGIDSFLKAGTAICSIAFVTAGILIAVEAWSKASGDPLPQDLDNLIVQTIEPNFTPGLLVLLSFSISLGIFASLQLGSQGASYKED
jgi:hypothetical protein